MTFEKNLEEAIRLAGALLLSSKFEKKGVPISKIKKIFSDKNIPFNQGLKALESTLYRVGITLKRLRIRQGSRFTERLIAITDPSLSLPEISSFDKETTAVLGIIFLKLSGDEALLSDIVSDVRAIVKDEELSQEIVNKAIKKLKNEGILRVNPDKEKIILTEFGKALIPPKDLIDKIIIETLVLGKKEES